MPNVRKHPALRDAARPFAAAPSGGAGETRATAGPPPDHLAYRPGHGGCTATAGRASRSPPAGVRYPPPVGLARGPCGPARRRASFSFASRPLRGIIDTPLRLAMTQTHVDRIVPGSTRGRRRSCRDHGQPGDRRRRRASHHRVAGDGLRRPLRLRLVQPVARAPKPRPPHPFERASQCSSQASAASLLRAVAARRPPPRWLNPTSDKSATLTPRSLAWPAAGASTAGAAKITAPGAEFEQGATGYCAARRKTPRTAGQGMDTVKPR
jgi:hypothetical protein